MIMAKPQSRCCKGNDDQQKGNAIALPFCAIVCVTCLPLDQYLLQIGLLIMADLE